MFIGFFIALIAVGTLLLSLPFSVSGGARTSFLDALFTATSAATGTGLTIYDTTTYWSPVGHWVLLGLFQAGGLGALVGSTVFLLRIASRVTAQERFLLHESLGVQSGRGILLLILGVTVYALTLEGIGAYVLASRLAPTLPADRALWLGVFHSASAFNNAGF
ncbi:MAG: Trk family potassium uptake protein, partial [Chloroflexi bacterium]|nr:Trk family potassium uptake protein [Chloroflexota bacterium]